VATAILTRSPQSTRNRWRRWRSPVLFVVLFAVVFAAPRWVGLGIIAGEVTYCLILLAEMRRDARMYAAIMAEVER
jgi:apolipoprotein N-acyltransferase